MLTGTQNTKKPTRLSLRTVEEEQKKGERRGSRKEDKIDEKGNQTKLKPVFMVMDAPLTKPCSTLKENVNKTF